MKPTLSAHGNTDGWLRRRSAFNHDWLKNQLLPGLAKFVNILDDLVEDNGFERYFLSTFLAQWPEASNEAQWIIEEFPNCMSPSLLLANPVFEVKDRELKAWMTALVHELWLVRLGVSVLMKEGIDAIDAANVSYRALDVAIKDIGIESVGRIRDLRAGFAGFRGDCVVLSRALERFPHRVDVT